MAMIRVPTGLQEVQVTVKKQSYLRYWCLFCGSESIFPYELQAAGGAQYHELNSQHTKNVRRENAQNEAVKNITAKDNEFFYEINNRQNYKKIDRQIICPYCSKVQPWSDVTGIANTKLFAPLIIISLASVIATILLLCFCFEKNISIMCGLLPVIIGVAIDGILVLSRTLKVKKNKAEFENNPQFIPPIYYNNENLSQLIDELKGRGCER